MLAHAEEAANADHDAIDLAGLVEQDLADVAELLVLVVIDVKPISLEARHMSPCVAGVTVADVDEHEGPTAGGWGGRSRRVVLGKRGDEHRRPSRPP